MKRAPSTEWKMKSTGSSKPGEEESFFGLLVQQETRVVYSCSVQLVNALVDRD
jgi:hypothetical protein